MQDILRQINSIIHLNILLMLKLVLIVVLVALCSAKFESRQNHKYWYTAGRSADKLKVAYTDIAWNYCDLKCLYLENFYNGDFVVINYDEPVYKPDFSACYVRNADGSYKLWNTVVQNKFFEENCGSDAEDYNAAGDKYKEASKEGVGRGNRITVYD